MIVYERDDILRLFMELLSHVHPNNDYGLFDNINLADEFMAVCNSLCTGAFYNISDKRLSLHETIRFRYTYNPSSPVEHFADIRVQDQRFKVIYDRNKSKLFVSHIPNMLD